MNRRTFLQSVGAAVAVVSIPAIAKPEPQIPELYRCVDIQKDFCGDGQLWVGPKWTDFVDHMPMTGQKVAVVTYFENHTGVNIFTGIVFSHKFVSEHVENVLINIELSYSPDGYFRRNTHVLGKPRGIDCDICLYGSLAREENIFNVQKKIRKASWIKKEEVYAVGGLCISPRYNDKKFPYVGRDRSWWIPISNLIPEKLPPLPDPRPLILDGEGNLIS